MKKSRKGKKRNVSRQQRQDQVDRQIKGGQAANFVVGCLHKGKIRKSSAGTAMAVVRALGVKPNPLTMGRSRNYTMAMSEQVESGLSPLVLKGGNA